MASLLTNIPADIIVFAEYETGMETVLWRDNLEAPKWVSASLIVAVVQIRYWAVPNPIKVVKKEESGRSSSDTLIPTLLSASKKWRISIQDIGIIFYMSILLVLSKLIIFKALSSFPSIGNQLLLWQ